MAVSVTGIPTPAVLFEELSVITEVTGNAWMVSVAATLKLAGTPSESDTVYNRV
jgi:hypothetical protein